MKINFEGTLVEFVPENDTEKKELSTLWDFMVDCAASNRKLVPVGEYVVSDPERSKQARFNLEDN